MLQEKEKVVQGKGSGAARRWLRWGQGVLGWVTLGRSIGAGGSHRFGLDVPPSLPRITALPTGASPTSRCHRGALTRHQLSTSALTSPRQQ